MKALKPVLLGIAALGILFFALSFAVDALASPRWIFLIVGVAALTLLPNSRVLRAAFGTAVLTVFVFFITQILGMTGLERKNIDLTEDDRYTLTKGTKAILGELSEPVVINYYVSRDLRSTPADLKRYIPRVDNLLEEFASRAKEDNITINFIDPRPNTDEEDAATLDQIQQVPVSQTEDLFFGASISCWDKKTVIPFFNPQSETQLEFDLISAIAEVSASNKPTVGLVSALDITSGGQTRQGWIFSQYLKRVYNLADLGMGVTDRLEEIYAANKDNKWGEAPGYLDPEKIPVVLVIHPAQITPQAEYQLDQYLLRGGTVIACVDAFSVAAQQESQAQRRPQIPGMPAPGGVPTESTLPRLFGKLGITFSGNQVLADGKFGMDTNPALLRLNKEAMPVEDDIALASIDDLVFGYAGAFTEVNAPGLELSRLLRSSRKSDLVDAFEATNPQAARNLSFKLRSEDRQYDIMLYLSGNFETAFPDGKPKVQKPKVVKPDGTEVVDETEEGTSLKTAQAKGHLYLFSDSDFLYDGAAYRLVPFMGRQGGIPQQLSENGPLVFNILDQATNSKHLVGARARTSNIRPFTVFQDMRADFREETGRKTEALQAELQKANEEIQKLQAQREDQRSPFLNEEQQEAIARLREKSVAANKSIRELEKDYQASEDAIKSGIFWKSFVTVPCIVILISFCMFIFRSIRTQAR